MAIYINAGSSAHYAISYDNTMSKADGADRAAGLLLACDQDYNLIVSWFRDVKLGADPLIVHIDVGSYATASWNSANVSLIPGSGSSVDLCRYLLVSEVTEMFMQAQALGWYATNEGSAGEGLSRFLATQFLIANGLGSNMPGFQIANFWLNSTRADYVTVENPTDNRPDAVTGCSILFIYYLNAQLGFDVISIVAGAAANLTGVYRRLTGDSLDPFPDFYNVLLAAFPSTNADGTARTSTITGPNPDNPFPLPSVHALSTRRFAAALPLGFSTTSVRSMLESAGRHSLRPTLNGIRRAALT